MAREAELAPVRLTAKERILLHLLDHVAVRDAVEVPPDITQDGIARAAGIELRHLTQYVRPLLGEELVRERTAHVRGGRQRRRVYELTPAGQMAAYRLRDRARAEKVRVRDASGTREVTVAEALEATGGRVSLLGLVQRSGRAAPIDLAALALGAPEILVEFLTEAPRVERFVGRRAELDTISEGGTESRCFVVRGVAGIGKSTLAAKVCERLRGRCHLYWHTVRPWDTRASILAGLGEFLAAVGRPGVRSNLSDGEVGAAADALREDLPDTKALFVFDDAHEASGEVLALFRLLKDVLPQAPAVRALFLTRRALAFYDRRDVAVHGRVREMDLAGLGPEDVAALLVAEGPVAATDLGRRLGGHPLLLELIRASARTGVRGAALRDVRRFIEEEIYEGLTDPERRVLKTASLYRLPVPREALFADPTATHEVLLSLANRALLRPVGEDGFELHDTIRVFFSDIIAPAEREPLHRFARVQLRALADRFGATGRDDGFIACVSNALRLDPDPGERVGLWEALGDAHERIGDLPATLTAFKEALRTATDRETVVRLHRKIATALQVRGEGAAGSQEAEEGLKVLGTAMSPERGWLDLVRSGAAYDREQWDVARARARDALAVFRDCKDLRGQIRALHDLASVEIEDAHGDPRVAEQYLRSALDLCGPLEEPDLTARVHISLAHLCAYRLGDVARAQEHVGAAEPLAAGPHLRRSLLMLRSWMLLEVLADFPAAERSFTEALAHGRRIHATGTMVFARYGLALTAYFDGQIEVACAAFEQSSEEMEARGYLNYAVEARWMSAECRLRRGDLDGFRVAAAGIQNPKLAEGLAGRPVHGRMLTGLEDLLRGDRAGFHTAFEAAVRDAEEGLTTELAALAYAPHTYFAAGLRALGDSAAADGHLRRAERLLEQQHLEARRFLLRTLELELAASLRQALALPRT